MLDFPAPEHAIKLRLDRVLHDRADVPDAERRFLSLVGLLQHVPDDETQTARQV